MYSILYYTVLDMYSVLYNAASAPPENMLPPSKIQQHRNAWNTRFQQWCVNNIPTVVCQ